MKKNSTATVGKIENVRVQLKMENRSPAKIRSERMKKPRKRYTPERKLRS